MAKGKAVKRPVSGSQRPNPAAAPNNGTLNVPGKATDVSKGKSK